MKFHMKNSIISEHLPIPSLNQGIKELVELYAELGPLEVQLVLTEDKLEVLREAFGNHRHYSMIDNGLDQLAEWIGEHLPKAFHGIEGVYHVESEYRTEHELTDNRFPDWHHLKGHRISEHPRGYVQMQVDFEPGIFPDEHAFADFVKHKLEPWFHSHGMKTLDVDEATATDDHTQFIANVHVYVFDLDVEVMP